MREEKTKEYDLMTQPKDTRLNAKANFKSAMKNDSVHVCVVTVLLAGSYTVYTYAVLCAILLQPLLSKLAECSCSTLIT